MKSKMCKMCMYGNVYIRSLKSHLKFVFLMSKNIEILKIMMTCKKFIRFLVSLKLINLRKWFRFYFNCQKKIKNQKYVEIKKVV